MNAQSITATATVIIAALGVVGATLLWRVYEEVKTMRGQQTIGTITAGDESRRVGSMARELRTPTEQRHLDSEALKEAPQGPE